MEDDLKAGERCLWFDAKFHEEINVTIVSVGRLDDSAPALDSARIVGNRMSSQERDNPTVMVRAEFGPRIGRVFPVPYHELKRVKP